jgi:hypothetical protein
MLRRSRRRKDKRSVDLINDALGEKSHLDAKLGGTNGRSNR